MNILYICDEYPPGKNGGIGTITQALARRMVIQGHNVFVAGLYMHGYGGDDHEIDDGVMVWRKRLPFDSHFKNSYSLRETFFLKSLTLSGILQKQLAEEANQFQIFVHKLVSDYKIDVVEWPDFAWYSKYLPAGFKWQLLPVPLVVKFHGCHTYLDSRMNFPLNLTIYETEKNHLKRADAFISVSNHTAKEYNQLFNLPGETKVLYNSIELREITTQARAAQTVIFTGSYVKLKGIEMLLQAWENVIEKYPAAELHLYGKGKISSLLYALSAPARLSVYDNGFQPADVIANALQKASAAVFPSFTECFALAPMEAMVNGCPVIYTNSASGPELINHMKEGILVDPKNPECIADAICLLLSDNVLAEKLASSAREKIQSEFTTERSAKDHMAFYKEIISASHKVVQLQTGNSQATIISRERII
jgi:glycogen synthase